MYVPVASVHFTDVFFTAYQHIGATQNLTIPRVKFGESTGLPLHCLYEEDNLQDKTTSKKNFDPISHLKYSVCSWQVSKWPLIFNPKITVQCCLNTISIICQPILQKSGWLAQCCLLQWAGPWGSVSFRWTWSLIFDWMKTILAFMFIINTI